VRVVSAARKSTRATSRKAAEASRQRAYDAKHAEAFRLLEVLNDRLDAHACDANAKPGDWSHVGDLTHLVDVLRGAYGFLGGKL
jgi:ferric-dicitrate binding protein FerR (iron transport regulator)